MEASCQIPAPAGLTWEKELPVSTEFVAVYLIPIFVLHLTFSVMTTHSLHLQVTWFLNAILLLLFASSGTTAQTVEPENNRGAKPRTVGPLLGGIGSALLGVLSGLLTEDELGPLPQYFGPAYSPFPFINRPIYNPYYGYFNPYVLYGHGNPAFGYPFFRNARSK
jgi:hypothetical protein